MKLFCILLASGAFAQTASPPVVPPSKPPVVQSPQASLRDALEQQKASIAKQQQAIRQQAQTAGVRLIPWSPPEPKCDAIEESVIAPLIENAAKAQKLEPALIRAVAEKESALRPCAISAKGAEGLMQLMPATVEQLGVHDVFDPKENLDAGAQFLKQLLDKYGGDLAKALGAYNAGPAMVDQAGGIPDIPETRDYVDTIMKKLDAIHTVQPNIPKPKPIEN